MSVYKLAAVGAGGVQNGIAQVDVTVDGLITAIHANIINLGTVTGNEVQMEASFLSVNTIGVNDTRGSLFNIGHRLIAGGSNQSAHSGVGGLAIVVTAGERMFLHIVATAAVASSVDIYIYVEDGAGLATATRRR